MDQSKYHQRGVSSSKSEVHDAIKNLDKGLYPLAFCKILPDLAGGDDQFVNVMHADTAGTKTSLAYLYWKETGDLSVWEGIAQDALVMNLDDMACVGGINNILISSTIGRNKNNISGEVLSALINGGRKFVNRLKEHHIHLHLSGGETADVGDIVRTIDVGYTTFVRIPKDQLIVNNIKAGDAIVGLASYGKATYENAYNSGISSNGLTSARHDLLSKKYADKYPESYDPLMPDSLVYIGDKRLTDPVNIDGQQTDFGKLLLSPTRTYLPVLKQIFDSHQDQINGIIHCTGGGQTKVKKFIENKRVVKNNLLPIPPLFNMIQETTKTEWKEMFQVFNMGHRLEIYLPPEKAERIIEIAKTFNIQAQVIGFVEESDQNEVVIQTTAGTFHY